MTDLLEFFDRTPDLVCTHDLDGNIRSANPAACAALGYPAEELVRMNVADLLADNAKRLFASYIHTLRSTGEAVGRMEVRTRLGDTRIWEYRNVVLSGHPPLVGGMARDVTEPIRTLRTLSESETHFRPLVENGPDIIGIVSTDGVKRKPVVVELPDGSESIAIHSVGNLALTWDHRAFDGAYASAFLGKIKDILETRDWSAEL